MRWTFVVFGLGLIGGFCFFVKQWFELRKLREELKNKKENKV